jgi:hypothetical protein
MSIEFTNWISAKQDDFFKSFLLKCRRARLWLITVVQKLGMDFGVARYIEDGGPDVASSSHEVIVLNADAPRKYASQDNTTQRMQKTHVAYNGVGALPSSSDSDLVRALRVGSLVHFIKTDYAQILAKRLHKNSESRRMLSVLFNESAPGEYICFVVMDAATTTSVLRQYQASKPEANGHSEGFEYMSDIDKQSRAVAAFEKKRAKTAIAKGLNYFGTDFSSRFCELTNSSPDNNADWRMRAAQHVDCVCASTFRLITTLSGNHSLSLRCPLYWSSVGYYQCCPLVLVFDDAYTRRPSLEQGVVDLI